MPPMREQAIRIAEGVAPYAVEFLGSFFVVLTYGFNVLTGSLVWMSTSVACAIMVSMAAAATVSGGHLNPAVSLAFGLARKMGWFRVLGYCAAQLCGGVLAGYTCAQLIQHDSRVGPLAPWRKSDFLDSLITEVVFTTVMCFVALNCLASVRNNPQKHPNQFSAVAVGFVYIAGGQAAYEISGAFFNPALTFGFSFIGNEADWVRLHLYFAYQALGAVFAAMLFFMLRPEEFAGVGSLEGEGLDWRRSCQVVCPCLVGRGQEETGEKQSQHVDDEEALATYLATYRSPLPARLLAECLGTFVVVFTFGLSSACAKLAAEGAETGARGNTTSAPSGLEDVQEMANTVHWATAAALLSLTYALADVSGAHFNPAVTLAATFSQPGMCQMAESLPIIISQIGGGVAAALLYTCCFFKSKVNHELTTKTLGPGEGHRWHAVVFGETVFTCAVALVVLAVTVVPSRRYPRALGVRSFPSGLAIGFCVAGAGFACESQTGGILNPAIAVGVATANVLNNNFFFGTHLGDCMAYVTWEMLGGLIASILFVLTHPLEYKRDPLLVQ